MMMNKNNADGKLSDKKRLLRYIGIRLASLVVILIVFK